MKKSRNERIERYFVIITTVFLVIYACFIVSVLASNLFYTDLLSIVKSLLSKKTYHSIYLSLLTSGIATGLAILIGIPSGYILARFEFPGKRVFDMIINIPITLPPLVAGLSLLILFTTSAGQWVEDHVINLSFSVAGIVLAQFFISASFAVITLKTTFQEIDESYEIVARSLGCNRLQAFWKVTLPAARYGLISALILTWARAVGEFVPVMLFCGAVEWKTDIVPISIFLNIEVGNLKQAIGLTMIFIVLCITVLPLSRLLAKKSQVFIE